MDRGIEAGSDAARQREIESESKKERKWWRERMKKGPGCRSS